MPDKDAFLKSKPKTSLMLCANFGEGKTTVAISFPKFFYIGFRQGGLEVLRQPKNEKYWNNLVRYEELVPETDEDLVDIHQPEKGSKDGQIKNRLARLVKEATEMTKKGEVETLILDDSTDWVETKQKYVWKFREKKSDKTGNIDTMSMYGDLKNLVSDDLDRIIMPYRKHGNLVFITHLVRETDQTMQTAAIVDKTTNLNPDIVGAFRREIHRKFENVIFMESVVRQGERKFVGYTQKQAAMGTIILAKNVLGLPPVIDNLTYETLMANVNKVK